MKQMTDALVRDIGQYFGDKNPSNVGRAIAKLEEQSYKRIFWIW
jgi:hypothetical protein